MRVRLAYRTNRGAWLRTACERVSRVWSSGCVLALILRRSRWSRCCYSPARHSADRRSKLRNPGLWNAKKLRYLIIKLQIITMLPLDQRSIILMPAMLHDGPIHISISTNLPHTLQTRTKKATNLHSYWSETHTWHSPSPSPSNSPHTSSHAPSPPPPQS